MEFRPLFLALAAVLAAPSLPGADIQSNYWYESTISSDANGPLDLLAELKHLAFREYASGKNNPHFPALRSDPTAASGAYPKSKFLGNHE